MAVYENSNNGKVIKISDDNGYQQCRQDKNQRHNANKTITLSANALNKKNVTIGGTYGYFLALANDVTKAKVSPIAWNLNKTTATLSQKQNAGYVCNGSTIGKVNVKNIKYYL